MLLLILGDGVDNSECDKPPHDELSGDLEPDSLLCNVLKCLGSPGTVSEYFLG